MSPSAAINSQLQPRPLPTPRRPEPRSGRTEHELHDLAPLRPDLEPAPLLAHGHDDAHLEPPTEVGDPRPRTNAGYRTRGTKHPRMLDTCEGPQAAHA